MNEEKVLLENKFGQIILRSGGDDLVSTTSDKKGTIVFLVLGLFCIYASIALMVWRLSKGEIHVPSLFGGGFVFVVGILLQWFGFKRRSQTGTFIVTKAGREIRNASGSHRISFNQVCCARVLFDPIELYRLDMFPEFPLWLAIEFNNGKRVRVGKAPRKDLTPVLKWLTAAGIPYIT